MKKIYLIFLLGVFAWGLTTDILGVVGLTDVHEILTVIEALDYLFLLIALIGYHAYVYKKELTGKRFWKVFAVFFIVWTVAVAAYNFYLQTNLYWTFSGIIAMEIAVKLVFIGVMIPLFIGLNRYAYKQ